ENAVEVRERLFEQRRRKPYADAPRLPGRHVEHVQSSRLRAARGGIDGIQTTVYDALMKRVLEETPARLLTVEARDVRFVVGEQELGARLDVQERATEPRMLRLDHGRGAPRTRVARRIYVTGAGERRLLGAVLPAPGIAEPQ